MQNVKRREASFSVVKVCGGGKVPAVMSADASRVPSTAKAADEKVFISRSDCENDHWEGEAYDIVQLELHYWYHHFVAGVRGAAEAYFPSFTGVLVVRRLSREAGFQQFIGANGVWTFLALAARF